MAIGEKQIHSSPATTVRETKAKSEGDSVDAKGTLPGNTGGNPNATPDAGTSGANSPRK